MRKPLRGRRSGPLWFFILVVVGGALYGVNSYLTWQRTAQAGQTVLLACEALHQAGQWAQAVTACATAVTLAPGNPTVSLAYETAATRVQVALAATSTAQGGAAATPTPPVGTQGAPAPTASPQPSATPTPTPAPDFYQLITDFRRAERAALQTLDPNVLAQVPVFAHGEALAAITQQVETLRAAGHYEVLIVENIKVEQVMPGAVVGVLASERHSRQTFERASGGDRLLAQEVNNVTIVYGFVEDQGRWKIDKVRIADSP